MSHNINTLKGDTIAGPREVDLQMIRESTGLPADYFTPENIRHRIMPAIAATFSDGEIVIDHSRETDPVAVEYFGETNFNTGTFGGRLRELLDGDDEVLRNQVGWLVRFGAAIFAEDVARGLTPLLSTHLAAIDAARATLTFDQQTVSLASQPQIVVDYGPGLQGRFHVRRQIQDMNEGRMPYTYFGFAKGPFIHEFLMQYWVACSNEAFFKDEVLGRIYIGRDDGMGAASEEMIKFAAQQRGAADVADVVLASGVHTAGFEELEKGIKNAHTLLKPEGVLLVRAPKSVIHEKPGTVPADAMVAMADVAGFDTDKAQYFDTVTGPVDDQMVQSLAAVFRK